MNININFGREDSILIVNIAAIVSGVLIQMVYYWINQYFFEPVKRYKSLKEKISYFLVLHANKYSSPLQLADNNSDVILKLYSDASDDFRKLGAEVAGIIEMRPKISKIPSKKKLEELKGCLIDLSNSFYLPYNMDETADDRKNTRALVS